MKKNVLYFLLLLIISFGFINNMSAYYNEDFDLYVKGFEVSQNLDNNSINYMNVNVCVKGLGGTVNYYEKLDLYIDLFDENGSGFNLPFLDYNFNTSNACQVITIKKDDIYAKDNVYLLISKGSVNASLKNYNKETSLDNNLSIITKYDLQYSKELKDKYYGLAKEVYYKLYTTGKITNDEYTKLVDEAYNYIYKSGSNPEKIYNSALEYEKKINSSTKTSVKNNFGLSDSLLKLLNNKINSLPNNQKLLWSSNLVDRIDVLLSKKTLSEKSKQQLIAIQNYLQDYIESNSIEFNIEELIK